MLAKCANPTCSARFLSLKQGRLFLIEATPSKDWFAAESAHDEPRPLQHYWLCGSCCKEFTVTRVDREIRVVAMDSEQAEGRPLQALLVSN